MRDIIYQTIRTAVLAVTDANNNSVVGHVDIWNRQLDLIEEEQPFDTPAVFIEFGDISWQTLPHGRREAVVAVKLHVVTDSRVGRWDDAMARLSLLDDLYAALFGLTYSDSYGNAMDSLTLAASHTDHYFDELQDNTETYSCHITDASIMSRIPRAGTKAPEISISILGEVSNAALPDAEESPVVED